MALPELTTSPARAARRAAQSVYAHSRELTAAAGAVLTITGAGVLAGALAPALAGSTHPHPTLVGTVGEASSILLNNLRALPAPFLLVIFGFPAARITRTVGDLAVAAILALNCIPVGIALGRWQGRLLPYVPHLPIEFSALTCSTCAWLIARDNSKRRRELAVLALTTVTLLIGAACLETWATPHRSVREAVSDTRRVDRPFDQRAPRRVAGGGLPRRDFAPATASRFKVAALPSPHQGSVPLGRLAGAFGLHQPPPTPTGGIE
ncbi:MAG: hypothetical protein M3065_21930 [Actinomycetota bacterium]|nr:hypothetical protein [Actinomycetota bacterium]